MPETDLPEPAEVRSSGLSVVWLMPLLAVAVAGYVVWQTYANQGPLITVSFSSASGIKADETQLRFRDMQVGLVEGLDFADDLRSINVHIRLDQKIAPYVDEGAEFWLVEPRVSARGVTGLDTVLSGVYIQGNWDGEPGLAASEFTALDQPPLITFGDEGTRLQLRAAAGHRLSAGAPVLFNGVEVGRLGTPTLSDSGAYVTIDAFIETPHDARLTTNTRFWDSSGVSLDLGAGGISVNFDSVATLLEGGVSFDTLVSGGNSILPGHIYQVFPSEDAARAHVFDGTAGVAYPVSVLLDEDVEGLAVGAPVRFQGLKIGEVTAVSGYMDDEMPEAGVRLLVDFTVNPARLGLARPEEGQTVQDQMAQLVENGLRARLASEGLLAQTVVVDLVIDEEDAPATLRLDKTALPLIPATASVLIDPDESFDGLIERFNNLPIETLMDSAIDALDAVAQVARDPELRQIPTNANALLTDARAIVGSSETQEAVAALQTAAVNLQTLTDRIMESEGLESALAAMTRSDAVMQDIAVFTEALPAITANVQTLTETLAALPLADVGQNAASALSTLNTMISAEGTKTLIPTLTSAVASLDAFLVILEDGEVAIKLSETVAGADELIAELRASNTELQQVLVSAGVFADGLQELDLSQLATELTALSQRASGLLAAPGVEDLPAALNGTLQEAQAILAELRAGGAVESLNSALDAAESSLNSVETAAAQVAPLVSRFNALASSLDALVADYASGSRLHGDLRDAISQISDAAESFRSLARSIERNPNSLITGRR